MDATLRWQDEVRAGRAALRAAFLERADTPRLLREHARLVDRVIASVWRELGAPASAALVAVGGYGRGELFPHSDVDVLILLPGALDSAGTAFVERLVGLFWDIGLEAGHSVRTIGQCIDEMKADVTIRTSLLEHRFVAGSRSLHRTFARQFAEAMDVPSFYEGKMLEQQQRHLKYHDTAYNLEPNVKESPGGLRDLQTVLWIARAAGLGRGGASSRTPGSSRRRKRARCRGRSGSSARFACGSTTSPVAARTGWCSTCRPRSHASWGSRIRRRGARASS